MKTTFLPAVLVATAAVCHTVAAQPDLPRLLEELRVSSVVVEYHLKYDNNTPPPRLYAATPCPACGETQQTSAREYISEERPLETLGWLVTPDTVLLNDINATERFIDAIRVGLPGGQTVPAVQSALFKDHAAVLLKLEGPVPGARPLAFAPAAGQPSGKGFVVTVAKQNTDVTHTLKKINPAETPSCFNARHGHFATCINNELVLHEDGRPAGFALAGLLPLGRPPFLTPPFAADTLITLRDFAATGDHLEALRGRGIHLATLNFRSPRESGGARNPYSRWNDDDADESSTVHYAVALHLAPEKLLVLKALAPRQTARLESITILGADGAQLPATFNASFKHFGAFAIAAPGLDSEPIALFPGDMRDLFAQPAHELRAAALGPQLSLEQGRTRLTGFSHAWRGLPTAAGDTACLFFTPRAQLVTIPVSLRTGDDSDETGNFAASHFSNLIAQPPADEIDPFNIPLSAADELRIAWFGVEVQALTPELAQEYKVAHLVYSPGTSRYNLPGVVISHVYPGSPAEKAGLKTGDILLRVISPDRREPYPVKPDSDTHRYIEEFPWQEYGEIPVEYLDRIPTPWPPAENALTTILTQIGFGKTVRIQCVIDGAAKDVETTVELSPPVYENAPQAEITALGCFIRDLTYEVRHYFRRQPQDPGVILSRVEPGQHAAVAGLRPYEIITKVGDTPVHNIREFQDAIKDKQELQLTVRRMNRERIVRIDLGKKPQAKPAGGIGNLIRGMFE